MVATKIVINGEEVEIGGSSAVPQGVNLLDNWYFVGGGSQQGKQFPINQRGETEYSGTQVSIDRIDIQNAKISLKNDGVTFSTTSSEGYFLQKLENGEAFIGKTLTFSVLIDDDLCSITGIMPAEIKAVSSGYIFKDIDARVYLQHAIVSGVDVFLVGIATHSTNGIKIKAAKLELGPVQTLAHKEGDEWVLNDPPPNYALELAKCQRYYWKSDMYFALNENNVFNHNSGNRANVNLNFPAKMRTVPTVTIVSRKGTAGVLSNFGGNFTDSSVKADAIAIAEDGFPNLELTGFIPGAYAFRVIADANL